MDRRTTPLWNTNILELRTDPELLELVRKTAGRKLTAAERREQRISFVFGQVGRKSGLTLEEIRRMIEEREGL